MKIEFISYTGKYPNLCSGVLTVKIDDKEYKFGHDSCDYDIVNNCFKDNNFEQFWITGGCIKKDKNWNMWTEQKPWLISGYWNKSDNKHPQWIIDIIPELLDIFNENVLYGCCGGCI